MDPIRNTESFPLLHETPALTPAVLEGMGNPSWETARARILIVRLSKYEDIAKSGSHLVLFAEARRALPGAYIDFAFLPERRDRDRLSALNLPWFFGRASKSGPDEFDLVLVSNAFALELINLPWLLSTAGIPMRASARARTGVDCSREAPIIVLGGSNASCTGSIVIDEGGPDEDSLADAIFFGEGELAIAELTYLFCDKTLPRAERLENASRVEGLWLPGSGRKKTRRIVRPFPPALTDYPVLNSEESGTARLMITSGCPGLCSFCLEGWDRLPYREAPLAELVAAAKELRMRTGAETLEVYSFNFNTHAAVFELFFELGRIFRRVNFMSQRIDILARTPGLVQAEFAAEKRSFTLGIEGISARMRAFYRKGLTESDLEIALGRLIGPGLRELKLFYIIGGNENGEDLDEFKSFIGGVMKIKSERSSGARITVSAGYLVRLPFTPLQYAPLILDRAVLQPIADSMEAACEAAGVEFRLASHFDEYGTDQVLALGGSALSAWMESVPAEGHVYDSSLSRGAWASLREYARVSGIISERFTGEKPAGWRPPLGFMEGEDRHAVLYRHYEEARSHIDRPLCLGGKCGDCGACAEATDRIALTGHRIAATDEYAAIKKIERLTSAKNNFPRILVGFELPQTLVAATLQYRNSWFLRRLSKLVPEAQKSVFQARETLFSSGELSELIPPESGFWGKCLFELSGPDSVALAKTALLAGLDAVNAGSRDSEYAQRIKSIAVEVSLTAPFAALALNAMRRWLSDCHIEYVEEKRREDGRVFRHFSPSRRDLKKGVIVGADLEEGGADCAARLELGTKAKIGEWLDLIDPLASRNASIRIADWKLLSPNPAQGKT